MKRLPISLNMNTGQKTKLNKHIALLRSQSKILEKIRDGEVDPQTGEWVPGPLYWLWNQTKTFDEHWMSKGKKSPYAPFPLKPYMPCLFSRMSSNRFCSSPRAAK